MADAFERESEKIKGAKLKVLPEEDSQKANQFAKEAIREAIAEKAKGLAEVEWEKGERRHVPRPHLKALFGEGKKYLPEDWEKIEKEGWKGKPVDSKGNPVDSYYKPYLEPYKGYTPKQFFKKELKSRIEARKKKKREKGRADIVGPIEAKKIEENMIEETADEMIGIIMNIGARVLEVARRGYDNVKNLADYQQRVDAKKFVYSDYATKEIWKKEPGRAEEEMKVKHKGKWKLMRYVMADIAAKYRKIADDITEWSGYWKFLKEKKRYPSWHTLRSYTPKPVQGVPPTENPVKLKERRLARFNRLPMDYELNRVITPTEMEILKDADEIISKKYIERAVRDKGRTSIEDEAMKIFLDKLRTAHIKPTKEAIRSIFNAGIKYTNKLLKPDPKGDELLKPV